MWCLYTWQCVYACQWSVVSQLAAHCDGTLQGLVAWLAGCLTSQQHASVYQGRICEDKCTCCHIEVEVADQTFYLTQSQYTDTGPTSPSDDPITPGAWQGSHWSANFEVTGMTRSRKSCCKWDSNPRSSALEADALSTRPPRRSLTGVESILAMCFEKVN